MYKPVKFPRLPLRRRLMIAALAVATAVTVSVMMLKQPAGTHRGQPPPQVLPADTARCTGAQTEGCLGGKAGVILLAPEPIASAP